ncbi:MAG: Csu type fimbrial protein [Rhodanobacteraceae bacterium]
MNQTLIRLCAALLLIGLGLFWHKPAEAQDISCAASMTGVAFGTVDPASSQTDSTGRLHYTCTNSNKKERFATICFSIGDGAQGAGQTNPRQMQDGSGDVLKFQLYQNSTRTNVWGSQFFGAFPTPYQVNVDIAGNGSITSSPDPTIYGRVLNGQTTAVAGGYQDAFSGGHTAITINEGKNAAPGSCDSSIASNFPFTVTATVGKKCTVNAATLDFGTPVGVLTSAIPGTSTINVQCVVGTPYSVGLDGGQNSGNNINARKMVLGGNSVSYQLYSDSARTQVWGNTANTDTVQGTGTGNPQSLTVYGKVPPQPTPPAGTYNDIVVVSVTY